MPSSKGPTDMGTVLNFNQQNLRDLAGNFKIGNEIPTVIPMFSLSSNTTGLYYGDYPTCGLVGNQRWRPLTGSRYDITYTSACIHHSNETPTVMPMFFGIGQHDYTGDNVVRRQDERLIEDGDL